MTRRKRPAKPKLDELPPRSEAELGRILYGQLKLGLIGAQCRRWEGVDEIGQPRRATELLFGLNEYALVMRLGLFDWLSTEHLGGRVEQWVVSCEAQFTRGGSLGGFQQVLQQDKVRRPLLGTRSVLGRYDHQKLVVDPTDSCRQRLTMVLMRLPVLYWPGRTSSVAIRQLATLARPLLNRQFRALPVTSLAPLDDLLPFAVPPADWQKLPLDQLPRPEPVRYDPLPRAGNGQVA